MLDVGYDTGVISGALVTIDSDLGPAALSAGQKVSFLFLWYTARSGCSLCEFAVLVAGPLLRYLRSDMA